MGIVANVFVQVSRWKSEEPASALYVDYTNSGWSSHFKEATIMNVDGPFDPRQYRPAVYLVGGPFGHPIIVRPSNRKLTQRAMFGGNFLFTSDARVIHYIRKNFEGCQKHPGIVPIHDRIEGS